MLIENIQKIKYERIKLTLLYFFYEHIHIHYLLNSSPRGEKGQSTEDTPMELKRATWGLP